MQVKKSKYASLEDKKVTYVLVGLVFVLSICYVAFEWTEKEVVKYDVADTEFNFEEEMDIQSTTQPENVPPPPPPPEVKNVEVLTVVEDDVETETLDISTEEKGDTIVLSKPVDVKEEEEEEEVVFMIVETMPSFPGGQKALYKYLSENIKYPVIAQENGIQGKVICQFVVNRDGSIVDVEAVRSSGDSSLDKEAVRVVKSMPKWSPGKQRGKAVRCKYTVPVVFRLQ